MDGLAKHAVGFVEAADFDEHAADVTQSSGNAELVVRFAIALKGRFEEAFPITATIHGAAP